MKTRTLIILMIISVVFIVGGIALYAWKVTMEAPLWSVKSPLISIFFCGMASGAGVLGFLIFTAGALQNTTSRIKKQIQKQKALKIVKKAKAV